jgi:hypothetical protein
VGVGALVDRSQGLFTVLTRVAHRLIRPITHAWLYSRIRADGDMAAPTDLPVSHGSGPDPDRVLLIGGPVIRGLGVASYELALSGHLARRLAALTGRGADIEVRTAPRFDTAAAAAIVRDENLDRFDIVVIVLAALDVGRVRVFRSWRRAFRELLGAIGETAPPTLPVLIVGTSSFARDSGLPSPIMNSLDETMAARNRETEEACRETGLAQYVHFTPSRVGVRTGLDVSAIYENWAAALAPALDRVLTLTHPMRHDEPELDEDARQAALDSLGVIGSGPDPRVDHIVQMARGMLGMSAAITFIDHDQQVVLASAGVALESSPRNLAFCNTTIESPGVFVVPDASKSSFRDATWASGPEGVRFYAGYPLEAPGGQRVGAFCVMDREPHEFSAEETSLLRDLALRAQAVLWEAAR